MIIKDMDLAHVEARLLADFSVLKAEDVRDLETALAAYAVKAQTGSREMETANRLFHHMTPAAQHRVRCKIDALRVRA